MIQKKRGASRLFVAVVLALLVSACERKDSASAPAVTESDTASVSGVLSPVNPKEDLKGLTIQMIKPELALPFCEHKECLQIDIQSLSTTDVWLDQWIEQRISTAILDLLESKQAMNLQQAVNRFVEASDQWQQQNKQHTPYQLEISTRIAMQRAEYVLLQVLVNAKVKDAEIQQRSYFFNSQRHEQKQLSVLDVIAPTQQQQMHALVQAEYQKWRAGLPADQAQAAPKTLYWGQADWFFDEEGIGLHYRAGQIADALPQFSIYFNREQTEKLLQKEIFKTLFQPV